MSLDQTEFEQRATELAAKGRVRRRQGTSIVYEKRPDGLLVPVTTADATKSDFPSRTLLCFIGMMFAIKTGLFVTVGEEQVMMKANQLAENHIAGRAAVIIMQPEPVSAFLVTQTEDILLAMR